MPRTKKTGGSATNPFTSLQGNTDYLRLLQSLKSPQSTKLQLKGSGKKTRKPRMKGGKVGLKDFLSVAYGPWGWLRLILKNKQEKEEQEEAQNREAMMNSLQLDGFPDAMLVDSINENIPSSQNNDVDLSSLL